MITVSHCLGAERDFFPSRVRASVPPFPTRRSRPMGLGRDPATGLMSLLTDLLSDIGIDRDIETRLFADIGMHFQITRQHAATIENIGDQVELSVVGARNVEMPLSLDEGE